MAQMSDKALKAILSDCGVNVKCLLLEDNGEYENNKCLHYIDGELVFDTDYVIHHIKRSSLKLEPITIFKVMKYGTILHDLDEYIKGEGYLRTTIFELEKHKYRIERKNGNIINAELI